MRLFIAEKPSLGEAIAQGLQGQKQKHRGSKGPTHITVGDDIVTWCFGHIYELLEPQEYDESLKVWRLSDLPIVPKVWKLKPKPEAKEQIKVIKELLGSCSEVVNAGDPDREGQLLVDEVLEELKCKKPVKRIWLSAIDEKSVRKALADLKDNRDFQNLKDSAQARSYGDWVVGMNATRKMTILGRDAGVEGPLSVGRVQTPTLALVVKRDQVIENFKPKDFFSLKADIEADGRVFSAKWEPGDSLPKDEDGRILDRNIVDEVARKISGQVATVKKFEAKEKLESQPLAYSLDKLQMECNRKFGLTAQQTLDIAQELYESKLTSYPRTDCGYLPENQHSDAAEILSNLAAQFESEVSGATASLKSSTWNDSKVTAHHGIIPTGVRSELSGNRALVYNLIVRRYVAQFYPKFKFLESVVELDSKGEKLSAKGRVTIELGWKTIYASEPKESDEDSESAEESLPRLRDGQEALVKQALVEAKKTTPPKRFTEDTLLGAMRNIHLYETDPDVKRRLKETSGIGTSATQANIIEMLKKRGYIEVQKKNLVSTAKGRELVRVLPPHIKSPGLTAIFEEMLEGISKGEISKSDFLEKQTVMIREFVQSDLAEPFKASGPLHSCPQCKAGQLRKRSGTNGPFWGCNKYPECKSTFPDAGGSPNFSMKPKAAVSEVEKCKSCGKGLVRRSGPRGFFWGCSGYPSCRTSYQDQSGKPQYA